MPIKQFGAEISSLSEARVPWGTAETSGAKYSQLQIAHKRSNRPSPHCHDVQRGRRGALPALSWDCPGSTDASGPAPRPGSPPPGPRLAPHPPLRSRRRGSAGHPAPPAPAYGPGAGQQVGLAGRCRAPHLPPRPRDQVDSTTTHPLPPPLATAKRDRPH